VASKGNDWRSTQALHSHEWAAADGFYERWHGQVRDEWCTPTPYLMVRLCGSFRFLLRSLHLIYNAGPISSARHAPLRYRILGLWFCVSVIFSLGFGFSGIFGAVGEVEELVE
jgi:hypothetical protein